MTRPDPRHARRAGALAIAAALLAAGAATAQTNPDAAPAAPSASIPDTVVTGAPDLAPSTVPDNAQRERTLREMPGNVSLVPATQFRDRPGVTTLQQALEYTPGVWAATKWGEDTRLSIRGSGLARNFHLRGVTLYLDGIPVNQADGSGDFQELDPLTAYRIEVLRGGNAFTLGIEHAGRRDQLRLADRPPLARRAAARGSRVLRLRPRAARLWRGDAGGRCLGHRHRADPGRLPQPQRRAQLPLQRQRRAALGPGRHGGDAALRGLCRHHPADPGHGDADPGADQPARRRAAQRINNYQRNIRSLRLGTITAIRPENGVLLELGGSLVDRDLNHPIFQVVDNETLDVTAFGRATLEGNIAGMPHWTVLGWNFAQGAGRNRRYHQPWRLPRRADLRHQRPGAEFQRLLADQPDGGAGLAGRRRAAARPGLSLGLRRLQRAGLARRTPRATATGSG